MFQWLNSKIVNLLWEWTDLQNELKPICHVEVRRVSTFCDHPLRKITRAFLNKDAALSMQSQKTYLQVIEHIKAIRVCFCQTDMFQKGIKARNKSKGKSVNGCEI